MQLAPNTCFSYGEITVISFFYFFRYEYIFVDLKHFFFFFLIPRIFWQVKPIQVTPKRTKKPTLPTRINNCMHYKVWDTITRLLANVDGAIVELWERKSNYIPHVAEHVIIYSCCDWPNPCWWKGPQECTLISPSVIHLCLQYFFIINFR